MKRVSYKVCRPFFLKIKINKQMTPELKIYLMTLMLPSLLDEIDAPMNPKTKSSFLRVTKFCEDQANEAAEAFYKHDSLKERHDAMVNHWNTIIDNVELG